MEFPFPYKKRTVMKVNKTTPSQQPLAATAAKILSTSSKDLARGK
jgi:hypothetical protein